jgi:hypothetical protein
MAHTNLVYKHKTIRKQGKTVDEKSWLRVPEKKKDTISCV